MALTFSIGDMKQAVIFQQNQPVDNDSGGQDDSWIVLLTTRCTLTKKRGEKGVEEGTLQFNKSYQMICRFQSDLAINQNTRVVIGGEIYQIMDYELEDQKQHLYVFTLNKVNV